MHIRTTKQAVSSGCRRTAALLLDPSSPQEARGLQASSQSVIPLTKRKPRFFRIFGGVSKRYLFTFFPLQTQKRSCRIIASRISRSSRSHYSLQTSSMFSSRSRSSSSSSFTNSSLARIAPSHWHPWLDAHRSPCSKPQRYLSHFACDRFCTRDMETQSAQRGQVGPLPNPHHLQ